MTCSLYGVTLCTRFPVVISGAVSLISWVRHSRNVPWLIYVGSPVVIGSWLLFASSCVGTTLRLTDWEAQPWLSVVQVLLGSPFGNFSDAVWSLPLGILVLWPFRSSYDAGQCQMLLMTSAEQPVWNYKVIHNLWLPLLGLGCRQVHTNTNF